MRKWWPLSTGVSGCQRASTDVNGRQRASRGVKGRQRASAGISRRQQASAGVSGRQRVSTGWVSTTTPKVVFTVDNLVIIVLLLSLWLCHHRLSQATTPSRNSGHHWRCMTREYPFEGNYGASTNTQSERLWKRTVRNAERRTRGLCLSPQALANWFQSLTSNSDCCYHGLSVATAPRSCSYQRPLAEKAAGWICKFSAREEFFTRTSQQPLTGSPRYWTYFEQAGTNGTPT